MADSRAREVFSGTESSVREMPLRLDPVGSVSGAPSTPGAAPAPGFVGGGGSGAPNPPVPQSPATLPSPERGEQAVPPGMPPGTRPNR